MEPRTLFIFCAYQSGGHLSDTNSIIFKLKNLFLTVPLLLAFVTSLLID
jgi:hypothetical protein